MPTKKNNSLERRSFAFEIRTEKREDGERMVRGHGAVYNTESQDLGGFREVIHPGAFDDAITVSDIRALINHDPNLILARTTSGTLKVGTDSRGLTYEFSAPDTSYARDLVVSMDRGDITQSSFAFTVKEDRWEELADGSFLRHIDKVERLYDVSPVTYPAYEEADVRVARRSLDSFLQEQDQPEEKPDFRPYHAALARAIRINENEAA